MTLDKTENERLEFALRFLINRHAHIAAAVLRLGELQFSDHIQTACIVANGDQVRLWFNRQFFNRIKVPELAGVLVHEAMHFCFRHQERFMAIRQQRDKKLFLLSCEAVINDLIAAGLKDLKLPGEPVTGQALLGRDVSKNSAEEVMALLRELFAKQPTLELSLLQLDALEEQTVWEQDSPLDGCPPIWTEDTSRVVDQILHEHGPYDAGWGLTSQGRQRLLAAMPRCKMDLSRFLLETIRTQNRFDTNWTRPNRKLISVYPRVILPTYESIHHHQVLIALDASGSIPDSFLASCFSIARRPLANTTVSSVSFDTEVYPLLERQTGARGGGGTSADAVEKFVHNHMSAYPDIVFCLTDGFFAEPQLKHPKRWIWILPPWGSTKAIPRGSRVEFFKPREMGRITHV